VKAPLINVTIPVWNEAKVLADSVRRVVSFLAVNCTHPFEIVIANNGSTDGTGAVAEEMCRQYASVRVVTLSEAGRGRTLKTVWSQTGADVLSYMDVDLSTDLEAFPALIDSVLRGGFDLATGSRRARGSITTRRWQRALPSWCYHLLLRVLFQTRLSDVQCGFKAISKHAAGELLPRVEQKGWLMDAELLLFAERLGYRICEVPVRWVEATDSRVRIGRDAVDTIRGLVQLRRDFSRRCRPR
jgi:glycosyltransferase involved in cell wall biosynthesis